MPRLPIFPSSHPLIQFLTRQDNLRRVAIMTLTGPCNGITVVAVKLKIRPNLSSWRSKIHERTNALVEETKPPGLPYDQHGLPRLRV